MIRSCVKVFTHLGLASNGRALVYLKNSRPDSGRGFPVTLLKTFQDFPRRLEVVLVDALLDRVRWRRRGWRGSACVFYLTQRVFKVVLHKSIPTQFVNLFFVLVIVKDKLTNLRGG